MGGTKKRQFARGDISPVLVMSVFLVIVVGFGAWVLTQVREDEVQVIDAPLEMQAPAEDVQGDQPFGVPLDENLTPQETPYGVDGSTTTPLPSPEAYPLPPSESGDYYYPTN